MIYSLKTGLIRAGATFFVLMASPAISMAAASCANDLHVVTMGDGAQLFMAASTYEGLSAHEALDNVQNIAADDGYVIATAPNYSTPNPSLGIGKPPSPIPMLIQIQQPSGISFTAIVPRGAQTNPEDVRAKLCALVDKFDSSRPVAPGRDEPVKTAAERLEESRTTIPVTKPVKKEFIPSIPFDLTAAKVALEPGHSVIKGQVCGSWKGNLVLGTRPVLLYPMTPYLEQVIALGKKAKSDKGRVLTDSDLVIARMEAKPDENGEFRFSKMKPGKYYLVTSISATIGGSRDVYIGHVSTGYGSASVYTNQNFSYGSGILIERFVNVRKDGDTVKETMQPHINPFNHAGLAGSILGCRKFGMKVSYSQ